MPPGFEVNSLDYQQLLDNMRGMRLVRTLPIFVEHVILRGGLLHDRPDAHACWYYCQCAMRMLTEVKEGAEYEGELDHINMLNNIARSVAAMYNLDSPNTMLRNMVDCKLEASRLDMHWDERIENPYLTMYLKRG